MRLSKMSFTAYQASPRGGIVQVTLASERALISGQAVTVLRGELTSAAVPGGAAEGAAGR
jgi:hypothetical protein